jgi:hypothetical protein
MSNILNMIGGFSKPDMSDPSNNEKTINTISNIEQINDHFKLPISYNEKRMELQKNIISDLELIKTSDSSYEPLYKYAFQPKTCFGNKLIEQFPHFYTTDVKFLKDTQQLLKTYKPIEHQIFTPDFNNIMMIWDEIKNDSGFKERYHYIDWPMWEHLNTSTPFLQLMSIYNLASPVLSLFVPLIMLIIPFFIIKMKGLSITVSEYVSVLKHIASNHAIGKIFTKFSSVSLNEQIYILVSAAFYVFSIYQNILTCIRFHQNMSKIHSHINDIRQYIEYTLSNMGNLLKYCDQLSTYSQFNLHINTHMNILADFKLQLDIILPYTLTANKIGNLGHVLKCFYDLYNNAIYNQTFLYSFGFNGYIDNIEGFIDNIHNNYINYAKINTKKSRKTQFKKSYYPTLIHNNPVKNTCNLKKNIIITGPNASGKTTMLKTSLINVIISQQMGCGFYESATISPFKYIHCYLNIPDTSGRDSLFQAESRRCKEILDIIKENKKESHFCVFDELYSGTNPEEAIMSATAFMSYLVKGDSITCILTTHFFKLCEHLEKNKNIENVHMETIQTKDSFKYTYKLLGGISTIHGGIQILRDMDYPKEIIDNAYTTK